MFPQGLQSSFQTAASCNVLRYSTVNDRSKTTLLYLPKRQDVVPSNYWTQHWMTAWSARPACDNCKQFDHARLLLSAILILDWWSDSAGVSAMSPVTPSWSVPEALYDGYVLIRFYISSYCDTHDRVTRSAKMCCTLDGIDQNWSLMIDCCQHHQHNQAACRHASQSFVAASWLSTEGTSSLRFSHVENATSYASRGEKQIPCSL